MSLSLGADSCLGYTIYIYTYTFICKTCTLYGQKDRIIVDCGVASFLNRKIMHGKSIEIKLVGKGLVIGKLFSFGPVNSTEAIVLLATYNSYLLHRLDNRQLSVDIEMKNYETRNNYVSLEGPRPGLTKLVLSL